MPTAVRRVLDSPGKSLDPVARSFYEPRLGHDLSRVRIHADYQAAASARAMNARAYTVGNDIVFGSGQFKPDTSVGRRLLAHEFVHTAQQSGAGPEAEERPSLGEAARENEAEEISRRVMSGQKAPPPRRTGRLTMACFSDTTHHVIEEAALPGAGFSPEQMKGIERGNIQRDYSQIGAVGNAILLGQAKGFGGYDPAEHFDNFIFDAVTNRWRTRGSGQQKFLHLDPNEPDPSPIDYIGNQLSELARAGMSDESLVHLGNAFHTVEDFFAHSNFIELVHRDYRFGKDLLTGSFGDNPANSAVSLAHTLGAVSPPAMQTYYERQAEAQTEKTEPQSHSRLAKDTPSSAGFGEARRLAALVIADLGADVISVMRHDRPDVRTKLMNEIVMVKIRRYLRPPDPQDPWWTGLATRDAGAMDARLAEAERRTPITVNQAPFSPLRNLEASRDSTMAIPLGLAVPIANRTWLQAGAGVTRPLGQDERLLESPSRTEERSNPIAGIQITGRF